MTLELNDIPLIKYPNPARRRERFLLLDGKWDFSFNASYDLPESYDYSINVPFSYETSASGIGNPSIHECVWYHRHFQFEPKATTLLHFLAVDYECSVYINRKYVGSHKGGFTSFTFDVTRYLNVGDNEIHVRVTDSLDPSQIRGKQRSKPHSYECWYVQTTGIWQSVYLETAGTHYVKEALIDGDKEGTLSYSIKLSAPVKATLSLLDEDGIIVAKKESGGGDIFAGSFKVANPSLWNTDTPYLYQLFISTETEEPDQYMTYVGFRTISTNQGNITINGRNTYLKMVLNQGYYPESGLTPPNQQALINDFIAIKNMGFNGCRIHQKIENPLFYYLADRYGLFLWSEIPSAYRFDEQMRNELMDATEAIVKQNYQSPAIIAYVLFNESWGIPQVNSDQTMQAFIAQIRSLVKTYDKNRLIISNDGWFQTSDTDILSLHEYEQDHEKLLQEYLKKPYVINNKTINGYGTAFVNGHHYTGQPIMITEFGGASTKSQSGWGYGDKAENEKELISRIDNMFETVGALDYLSGYCYTQLTDVEQETNGLLFANRTPKIPLNAIYKIVKRSGGVK